MRLAFLFCVSLIAVASSAAAIYDVMIDTSALIGHPAGPFAFEVQFNDGSSMGDGNNSVHLTGFDFGSGGPTGVPVLLGGATGSLSSVVQIVDGSFFNQFIQGFLPGAELRFRLTLSTNVDAFIPDEFSLAILDSSGFEIPTFGPANALLIIDVDSERPSALTFRSDLMTSPSGGGPPVDIPEPEVTIVSSSVPEPESLWLTGFACVAFALLRQVQLDRLRRHVRHAFLSKATS